MTTVFNMYQESSFSPLMHYQEHLDGPILYNLGPRTKIFSVDKNSMTGHYQTTVIICIWYKMEHGYPIHYIHFSPYIL